MADKPAAKLHPRDGEMPQYASKKGVWGWMFFDWAAQPFFTVITTFVFGPYVVSRMAEDPVSGQSSWGYGLAFAGLMIAILSPVLGSIADQTGPRKPWIAAFAALKIIMLISLWFAAPGSSIFWVIIAFSLASVAAEFSIVFNDSMMPRLVRPENIGSVSNTAWGLGYAGGMIVLIIVLGLLAASPETGRTILGIEPVLPLDPAEGEDARVAGPISALWYFIFILPMFLLTPDSSSLARLPLQKAVTNGLSELKSTISEARQKIGIFQFLIARMIYQDGVNALIALGGTFAAALFGWSIMELGIFGILLNIAAIPSCLIAGKLDTIFGSKRVVLASVACLAVASLGITSTGVNFTLFGLLEFSPTDGDGLFSTPAEQAYLLFGLLIGIAFGPVQASSRSYMARSVTPDDAGRYFGLYALSGRATSFLAPLLVAVVTDITDSARAGMSVILIFLVVGGAILVTTPYPAADTNER
ncbi:MAG: MFS transporter [Pseudomonadota bacterium]